MTERNLIYPEDFPVGVPPESATPANGNAYRLVRNDPPNAQDFCGYYREPYLKRIPQNPKPNFFGTSMFRDLAQTKVAREEHKPQRDKKIAAGTLSPEFGVVSRENQVTHFDAWLKENTGIENVFSVEE
ncbi:hypothetical protein L1D46_07835 [Pseudoalteromonas sp. Isolate3]|uniref:hypothetical protein n=1 Tax=Pseudoalteromonas sp. Isolate3 TaxID=2908526 RepID=UPI001EFCCB61|nr:hypothetical protein [Pseudoalteromonas sp. Isolate3]MCG9708715.1 hypothetical protein [Pseudoalteromonas sp. Isolate3]